MGKEAATKLDAAALKLAREALKKCARPDCREAFIKKFKRHRYCSPGCKAVMWKREHQAVS